MQSIFSPNNEKKVIRLKRDVVFFHGYILNKCQLSIFIQTRRHCKFTKYTLRLFLGFFPPYSWLFCVLNNLNRHWMLNTEHRAVRTRNTEQSVHGTRTPYTEQCAIVSIAICSIAIKKIFVRFGREQLMAIIVNNDKN